MYIPKETIDLVRDRCLIEDIVKRYVPTLKKKGKNYLGLCPFHKEKTPSFTVSPDKQIFYCFGCKEGGNVFTFISKIERLEFPESVKFIGDMIGVEVSPEKGNKEHSIAENMIRINDYSMRLYSSYLESEQGKQGKKYIMDRGLTEESLKEFDVGYAPESWNFLTSSLTRKNIDLKLAEQAGLVGESQKRPGSYYDRFRKRIIFPIRDKNGKVIAFGGRATGDETPKYLNSPETELFKKRQNLYGMYHAIQEIRELDRVIIVEGYLDVIGCSQAGIKNVVAPLGTALTDEQIKFLSRLCSEIILLFDADSAGMKAAIKSLEVSEEISVDIKVAALPEKDPFDFILEKGPREFMALVDQALKPVDFRISRILADRNTTALPVLLTSLFQVVQSINLESEKDVYLRQIGRELKIEERNFRADYARFMKKGSQKLFDDYQDRGKEEEDFISKCNQELIILLCNYTELIKKAVFDFSADDFNDLSAQKIFNSILEIYRENEDVNIDKLFDIFNTGREMELLNKALNTPLYIENPSIAYNEIYLNMKLHEIDEKINKYVNMITSNDRNHQEYLTEVEILRREKEKLKNYLYNKSSTNKKVV